MWRIILGIYDGDLRLTNDCKRSHRVGNAQKWLGKVGNARKCSKSVRRGSSIGHKCRNMRPEPGVAHQRYLLEGQFRTRKIDNMATFATMALA